MTRNSLCLAASAASLLMASGAFAAPALPTGAAVAAGSASIAASGASMTISQSTPKAIIDWSSFSIGQGGSVQFNNGTGATLNRVTGARGSSIDGLLSGTGSVYLINPNGVIVGKSGEVKVGGTFVASTLDVPDAGFLSGGNLTFSGPSSAAVVNEGKVGSLGGDVVLIAASVSNSGSLSAPDGTVGALAGQSVLLRDQALDDGKFAVLVGGPSTSATNSGLIEAANAELRANGGNVYALAGNTAGVVHATGVNQDDGHVWLIADGGGLDVAGTITARGAGGSGGTIETSGADVKIGASSIDAGVGGTWLVDPYDLTIDATAASSISGALNSGTNVTEQTTASGASGYGVQTPSVNGDIFVQAPISWSTSATLTLDAYRNVVVTSPVTVSGAGQVVLNTGSGGHLDFGLGQSGFAGNLSFTGTEGSGQSLTINGTPYTLIYSMSEIAGLTGGAGHDALAVNLTPASSFGAAVVGNFNGAFEGLGHVIENLTINPAINDGTGRDTLVGLFGQAGLASSITDLGLAGVNVKGRYLVGALAGQNSGAISRTFANGAVSEVSAKGFAGGLVGQNYLGSISWSIATGSVNATGAGATPYSSVGGLVGDSSGASIDHSYAVGSVLAAGHDSDVGGLVGSATGSISDSYATGTVNGADSVGGLAGASSATIANVFATALVRPTGVGGGLVGTMSGGSISGAYALGVVKGSEAGGFLGAYSGGSLAGAVWDTQTSGQSAGWFSGSPSGVTGKTTVQLQSGLPSGFSSSAWGSIPGVSYPYLLDFFPSRPQVVSGQVGSYANPATKFVGTGVTATVNGSTVVGSTSTFADGTYYLIAPGGTLPAGSTVIAYASGGVGTTAFEQVGSGASVTGANIYSTYVSVQTPDTTLSSMLSDLQLGLGSANSGAELLFTMPGGALSLSYSFVNLLLMPTAGFDFDQSFNLGSHAIYVTAAGQVTQSAGGITGGRLQGTSVGGLALTSASNHIPLFYGWTDSAGGVSFTNGASFTVKGAVNGSAITLTTASGDLTVSEAVKSGTGGVIIHSAGKVTESSTTGFVSSKSSLSVTSVGGLTMNGTNVGLSVSLANSGGGAIRYTSYGNLNLTSATNAAPGVIVLATALTTGGSGTMNIKGPINGQTVTLTSALGINETGPGAITTNVLAGQANGAVVLNGANAVTKLSNFTDTAGDFSFRQAATLGLFGTLDFTGRTASLTSSSSSINTQGTVRAATLNLTGQDLFESSSAGAIIVGTLNAIGYNGIVLTSQLNQIGAIGTRQTCAGCINHIQQ